MPDKDIANAYQTGTTVFPQKGTSTITGNSVDMQDCLPELTGYVSCGDIGGGTTVDVKLEESADDDSWSDISSATFTQLTASSDNSTEVKTFFNRSKRYVRATATYAGSSPDAFISVVVQCPKKSY